MSEEDRMCTWIAEHLGLPERINTNEIWPCGCALTEYTTRGDEDKTFISPHMCKEHRKEYDDELVESTG